MTDGIDPIQDREWRVLHDRIAETLDRFGRRDAFGDGDYWLVDDNWGQCRQLIEIQNLNLLQPHIVKLLQRAAMTPKDVIEQYKKLIGG